MYRVALMSMTLLLSPLPAQAAFQSNPTARPLNNQNCAQQQQQARRRGRGIGGFLGGAARLVGGPVGGVAGTMTSMLPVGELLGEAIASRLDCREQQQAASATETVVTRGTVGTTTAWTSETRPGVTGSSTVTAAEPATAASAGQCLTVTDVVIVDGEETRAPKRMCRTPPSNRYVRQV
jgi:surface antigen